MKTAGLVAEATPPATAMLYVVGVQGASGDLVINASLNIASTTLDFTALGLQEGSWGWLGGGTAATPGAFGFATAADRGFFRIEDVTANEIVVGRTRQTWAADTGTGKTIQIFFGPWWRNVPGTHADYREPSYTLEVRITPTASTSLRSTRSWLRATSTCSPAMSSSCQRAASRRSTSSRTTSSKSCSEE